MAATLPVPPAPSTLLNTGVTTLNLGGAATTIGIGAGTGTTTLSNNLTANLVDNNANALDIQQGSDNYININTTNSSENISFGNGTTNPSYTFLGNGLATITGNLAVNGGDITTSSATANLFNANATSLNFAGAATTLSIGAATGTTTVNNALTATGTLTASNAFAANGNSTFSPE